jgi:hypothetical protein
MRSTTPGRVDSSCWLEGVAVCRWADFQAVDRRTGALPGSLWGAREGPHPLLVGAFPRQQPLRTRPGSLTLRPARDGRGRADAMPLKKREFDCLLYEMGLHKPID